MRTAILGSAVSGYIVPVMGVGCVVLLNLMKPGVLDDMASSFIGRLILLIAFVFFGLGALLIRLVSRVEGVRVVAFSTAFLAACLVLAAAGGIRMIRDDGTGHLASTVSTISAAGTGSTVGTAIDIEERRQEGVFVKLIDTLGMRGSKRFAASTGRCACARSISV